MKSRKKKSGCLGRLFKFITAIILAAFLVVAATNIYTVATTRDDVYTVNALQGTNADAVVVLGASVYADGTPSPILADRLEVAVDLYKNGSARAIIVSGDNRDSHYNESDAMKNYCVELGVPADRVHVDHAGYDTYSSIWRAQNVYGAQHVIVTTQAYHLYRALATAQGLGMQAEGVPADKGAYDNQTSYSIRETLARTKDCIKTIFHVPAEDPNQPITM